MESLDGIAELHMSGARAVFKPAPGSRVGEAEVEEALQEQGLALTSFTKERRAPAQEIFLADAGIT